METETELSVFSPKMPSDIRRSYNKRRAGAIYGRAVVFKKWGKQTKKEKQRINDMRGERERMWCLLTHMKSKPLPELVRNISPAHCFPISLKHSSQVNLPILESCIQVPVKPSTAKFAARQWKNLTGRLAFNSVQREPFNMSTIRNEVFESKNRYGNTNYKVREY